MNAIFIMDAAAAIIFLLMTIFFSESDDIDSAGRAKNFPDILLPEKFISVSLKP